MTRFQTIPDALHYWAQEKPDSEAFVFRDKHQQRGALTWGSLYRLSGCFAAVLKSQGIARGDLVIDTLPNSPERVVCEVGLWMTGAASVNGQCLMVDGSDLLTTISVSRAPAILVDPDVTNSPWNVLKSRVVMEDTGRVTSSELPCLKTVIFVRRVENEGMGDFISHLKGQREWFRADDVTPSDVFTVMTTSGSKGMSKLVVRKQGPYIQDVHTNHLFLKKESGERVRLNTAPMGWIGGCLIVPIALGFTTLTCDMRPGTPDDTGHYLWTAIQEEKCNTAVLSPIHLVQVARITQKEQEKGSADTMTPIWKIGELTVAGRPCTQSLVQAGLTVAHNVTVAYGSTEVGNVARVMVSDSQTYTNHVVGRPYSNVEVKIVSLEDESKPCAVGQVGNILVKGPNMMESYLNNPSATADAFTEEGFFRTGDLGRLDERGLLIVDGRDSDAIMRGSYIFYPSWIENRLQECPGVDQAMVVGVPDPIVNEELCACFVLESDNMSAEQVREFAERVFASKDDPVSACPRHYLKFEAFPMTHTGKPSRKMIKAQAARCLGLNTESN